MVYLYLCQHCERDDHGHCELGHPAPPGVFGGDLCRCPCRGNPKWNTPEFFEEQLREITQKIIDHQKATEEFMRTIPEAQINKPSQKIHLKDP